MTRAEDFRAKAAEAERQAKIIDDSKLRVGYQELAKSWRQMAEQLETFEKRYGADPEWASDRRLGDTPTQGRT